MDLKRSLRLNVGSRQFHLAFRIIGEIGPAASSAAHAPLVAALWPNADRTSKHITDCQIPMWSPLCARRRGYSALDWMTTYAHCAGCHSGGGPPGLHHQDLRPGEGL